MATPKAAGEGGAGVVAFGLDEKQTARDARECNQHKERRQASSERDVIQDQGC